MKTEHERLWGKVVKSSGCWLWSGRRYRDGYGEFKPRAGGSLAAHRAVWEVVRGVIPPGMVVCHRCDNPPCVNPDHLFLGTAKDNERDKIQKGRRPATAGNRNGNARLTAVDVQEVRRQVCAGVPDAVVGAQFGVSEGQVRGIRNGRTWTCLPWETARPGPRPRGRPRAVRVEGGLWCGRCKLEKPEAEFAPSVVRRGRGWCRSCYAAWGRSRPT